MIFAIEEEWKTSNGYRVSNYGIIINKFGRRIGKRISGGYYVCCINLGEPYGIQRGVHRVVASLFIPNPDNKPEVNHIDGNKSNNIVDNLEWVTASENQNHEVLTMAQRGGEKQTFHVKITTEEALSLYQYVTEHPEEEYEDISQKYGLSTSHVANLVNGRKWRHLKLAPFNKKNRPVIGINLGTGEQVRFDKITDVIQSGYCVSTVTQCCKGKRDVYKGIKWDYENLQSR